MLKWKKGGRAKERMREVLEVIFQNHSKLLPFLFYLDRPELRDLPENLIFESGVFSSGEQLLIRVALDLWTGEVEVKLWDLIQTLDQETYQNVLVGLQNLRPFDPCGFDVRWRQPKMAYSTWERISSSKPSAT